MWLLAWPKKIRKIFRKIEFDRFYKSHSRIFIYGASAGGFHYDMYLNKLGYTYEGFCCSKRMPGESEYCNHKVYEFNEIKHDLRGVGFIIALQDENFERVRPTLDQYKCHYYRSGVFEGDFCYELGYRGASWYIGKIR